MVESISNIKIDVTVFLFPINSIINRKSVDPNQMWLYVMSDLIIHSLALITYNFLPHRYAI